MNQHFENTIYYLKRAGETAQKGISEELEDARDRINEFADGEIEPEIPELDELKADLEELQEKAEGEAKEAIDDAREAFEEYREGRKSTAE